MNRQTEHDIRRKTRGLDHAKHSGNVSQTCRKYSISRDTFYRWKRQFRQVGPETLVNSRPCPENLKIHVSKEIEEKFYTFVVSLD